MTAIGVSKFDCVIQSRDVRESRALKQLEKLRSSPMACPDGFEPVPRGFSFSFQDGGRSRETS